MMIVTLFMWYCMKRQHGQINYFRISLEKCSLLFIAAYKICFFIVLLEEATVIKTLYYEKLCFHNIYILGIQ